MSQKLIEKCEICRYTKSTKNVVMGMKRRKPFKLFIILLNVVLGCIAVSEFISNNDILVTSVYIIADSNGIMNVYKNGEDVTSEYLEKQYMIQNSIAEFLNRSYGEISFIDYCEMGNEGVTVDALIFNKRYPFTCDNNGEVKAIVQMT